MSKQNKKLTFDELLEEVNLSLGQTDEFGGEGDGLEQEIGDELNGETEGESVTVTLSPDQVNVLRDILAQLDTGNEEDGLGDELGGEGDELGGDETNLDLASTDLDDEDLDDLEEDKSLEGDPEAVKSNCDKGDKGKAVVGLKPTKGKAAPAKNSGGKAPVAKPNKGGADAKAFGKSKDDFIK